MEQFWPTSISSIVPSTSSVSEESFLFKNKYICLNIHSPIIYTCNCKMPSCEKINILLQISLCLLCKTLDSISWYEIPEKGYSLYFFQPSLQTDSGVIYIYPGIIDNFTFNNLFFLKSPIQKGTT